MIVEFFYDYFIYNEAPLPANKSQTLGNDRANVLCVVRGAGFEPNQPTNQHRRN